MAATGKERFTFRSAGALFMLSAVSEIFSLTDRVPLFGALRDGATVVTYHLLYAALFVIMGAGLWDAKRWGDKAVLGATAFYTVDHALRLLSPATLSAYLFQDLGSYIGLILPVGRQAFQQIAELMTLLFLACWWAFAWYTYARRDYFRASGK
ncbi:MAG: hypothetical protein ACYDHM_10590 [Acidiferrobacterales bacterium]